MEKAFVLIVSVLALLSFCELLASACDVDLED